MKLLKKIKTFLEEKWNFFFYKDSFGWHSQKGNPHIQKVSVGYQFGCAVKRLGLGFTIGSNGDDTFSIGFSIPFVISLRSSIQTRNYKWLPDTDRNTEFFICGMGIFLYFWKDDYGISKKWQGWNEVYDWGWILCGRNRTVVATNAEGKPDVMTYGVNGSLPPFINHPEGVKDARFCVVVTRYESTYPHRRYMKFFREQYTRITVMVPNVTIMVPGKGDSELNLGNEVYGDVTFNSEITTVDAAITQYCIGITRCMNRNRGQ